jgi:hypothetical protein
MSMRLVRALALAGAAVSFATAAHAATVQFASTVSFTESVGNLNFASAGLNDTLTVGVPFIIPQFISVTVDNGAWSASNSPLAANFVFTIPAPSGTTTDNGSITGGQVNGVSAVGTLSIVWPGQPVEFNFADGTKLDVTLGDLVASCAGRNDNNCLADSNPYFMSGTFLVLNGPTGDPSPAVATPLPGALPLMASGLGVLGFFGWRSRKRKLAA